jgi:putative flippase GtrA
MSMATLVRQAMRFALVGGSNTITTFALLVVLAEFVNHALAYSIVFALGASYAAAVTGRFVFSAEQTPRRAVTFLLWYIAVYLVGLIAVHLVDPHSTRSGVTVALTAVLVTAPLSFLGGRLIYRRPTRSPQLAKTGEL